LTREAIVGELLARERAALHRSVADALERKGGPISSYIESLAYHAHSARDWSRALSASTRAADHALSLHAPREALAHLDRALDAANEAGIIPEVSLRLARGSALETLGDLQGAHDEFAAALETARVGSRQRDAWEALHALGMLWAARDYARAGEYRREALVQARVIGDASLIARSLNRVANWHVNLEQPAPALRGHAEALELFESLGDRRGVAETVDLLAMTHFVAGNMSESSRIYERAVALHEANGDRRGLAGALALLCLSDSSTHSSCTSFGRTSIAQNAVHDERPLRLAREIGWRAGEAFALYLLGDSLGWQGEYQRAIPIVRESLAISEDMEHLQWQCGASRALGMMMLDLQAPELARIPLERAHQIALRLGSRTWTRWSAASLAIALARLGEYATALSILDDAVVPSNIGREALQPGDEDSPTLGERFLKLARAEVALEMGEPAIALAIVDERLAAEQFPVPRLTFMRARALMALDDNAAAEVTLRTACGEASATNAKPLLWSIKVAMGHFLKKMRHRVESRQAFDEALIIANDLASRVDEAPLRKAFERAVQSLIPDAPTPTSRQKAKASFGGLTSRERDVARLVAQGKANRAIARALGIGERTVEGYVAAALSKLAFSTRTQLAAWTVERELTRSRAKA
ncbi:MAG: helix-turn-helix transcriptional regulator, partial [Gemmatimonadaceae bacterium]